MTTGAWWLRGRGPLTLPWVVEAAAQAAARSLATAPGSDSERLALAGIDEARLERPILAGETCELRVRLAGRWGALAKVEADVLADGETIGRLALLLASASAARR